MHTTDWRSPGFLWPAPAKINLFLHITGRRADGYHLLQTVFQFLDFCDQLQFKVRADGQILRESEIEGVPVESDLTLRAARALQQATGTPQGADILVHKTLPLGGGLGGGSSDAATTLVALNRLWGTGLSREALAKIGLALGADVPVFVHGHAAWAEGVGEVLTPVDPPEPWYLLVIPPVAVNTGRIFSMPGLTRDCPILRIRGFLDGAETRNVCEPVVRQLYPEIDLAMAWLARQEPPRMTGTGACVFVAMPSRAAAEEALAQTPKGWRAVVCRGRNISPLYAAIE